MAITWPIGSPKLAYLTLSFILTLTTEFHLSRFHRFLVISKSMPIDQTSRAKTKVLRALARSPKTQLYWALIRVWSATKVNHYDAFFYKFYYIILVLYTILQDSIPFWQMYLLVFDFQFISVFFFSKKEEPINRASKFRNEHWKKQGCTAIFSLDRFFPTFP